MATQVIYANTYGHSNEVPQGEFLGNEGRGISPSPILSGIGTTHPQDDYSHDLSGTAVGDRQKKDVSIGLDRASISLGAAIF